jgi:hypothetical protein
MKHGPLPLLILLEVSNQRDGFARHREGVARRGADLLPVLGPLHKLEAAVGVRRHRGLATFGNLAAAGNCSVARWRSFNSQLDAARAPPPSTLQERSHKAIACCKYSIFKAEIALEKPTLQRFRDTKIIGFLRVELATRTFATTYSRVVACCICKGKSGRSAARARPPTSRTPRCCCSLRAGCGSARAHSGKNFR